MPFAPDKIIINSNETKGLNSLIDHEYESLNHLGEEIEDNGWEQDTEAFRDEMTVLCDRHYDAEMEYYQGLRELRQRLSRWVDDQHKKGGAPHRP